MYVQMAVEAEKRQARLEAKGAYVGLVPLLTGSVIWSWGLAEVRGGLVNGLARVLDQVLGVLGQVHICTGRKSGL